jgi:hypothetical protein
MCHCSEERRLTGSPARCLKTKEVAQSGLLNPLAFPSNNSKREFPNFGAGSGMTSEEWWAPIFYKTFLDLDMPKEDVDEVFIGVFEELYYEALPSEWAWEPVEDVLPVRGGNGGGGGGGGFDGWIGRGASGQAKNKGKTTSRHCAVCRGCILHPSSPFTLTHTHTHTHTHTPFPFTHPPTDANRCWTSCRSGAWRAGPSSAWWWTLTSACPPSSRASTWPTTST